jgi:hypothetical protein
MKWFENYNVHKLDVGKYIRVVVTWNPTSKRDKESNKYFQSVTFNDVSFKTGRDDLAEAKISGLYKTKAVIEQMLIDIKQAIKEQEDENEL